AIDFDDGPIALRDDLQGEPGVRFDKIRCDLSQRVQAAGLERILSIALKYLRFVTLGVDAPSEAVFRAKVNAAIAEVVDLGLDAKMKVLVIAACAEQMASRSAADQDAVLDAPVARLVGVRR